MAYCELLSMTACCHAKLSMTQASHANPLHGRQAPMLMMLELLLELLLLLLYVFNHVLLWGREAPPYNITT